VNENVQNGSVNIDRSVNNGVQESRRSRWWSIGIIRLILNTRNSHCVSLVCRAMRLVFCTPHGSWKDYWRSLEN
jgi:hypothetical protein